MLEISEYSRPLFIAKTYISTLLFMVFPTLPHTIPVTEERR